MRKGHQYVPYIGTFVVQFCFGVLGVIGRKVIVRWSEAITFSNCSTSLIIDRCKLQLQLAVA